MFPILSTLSLSPATSLGEGLPNVVLEAMACAKPLIATDGIGLNSIMGGAGIFVPPKDPRSLAKAILRSCPTAHFEPSSDSATDQLQ